MVINKRSLVLRDPSSAPWPTKPSNAMYKDIHWQTAMGKKIRRGLTTRRLRKVPSWECLYFHWRAQVTLTINILRRHKSVAPHATDQSHVFKMHVTWINNKRIECHGKEWFILQRSQRSTNKDRQSRWGTGLKKNAAKNMCKHDLLILKLLLWWTKM